MKIIRGIKIGGLQQKIFNLMLIMILALIGAYVAISAYQQRSLTRIVQETNTMQETAIVETSEGTMQAVLDASMTRSTALQAYIADDLFSDVRSDVLTLQAFAEELFEHEEQFSPHTFSPPLAENDGVPSVYVLHEPDVNPQDSQMLGLIANMSEILLARFTASDKLSGCFVGTADGNLLAVNDRSGSCLTADGTPLTIDVRDRPWYRQAAEAGELCFTGVEIDSYTGIVTLECAAPVYRDGQLAAVVGADIFLTAISDYVRDTATEGGFLCVVNEKGQILFSPAEEGVFQVSPSDTAPDLRESDNRALADFVSHALQENTGLVQLQLDGREYYAVGAPMNVVGWAVLSVVDRETTDQPTAAMLERYTQINAGALSAYEQGARQSVKMVVILTVVIILLAVTGALVVAQRVVNPLEHMTRRINALSGSDQAFEMEDVYRTDDEIEILAESFATLSKRTQNYITQITDITAEKERITTELTLANQIQASMLPHIFPPFPDRTEFDIFASMDPAKEVGGDFFDYFLVDDDHLCMVIADVSGKGVPAALFMMASKIILQSVAMLGGSPAEILTRTNEAICSNNEAEMFVTVWVGMLELSTGKLTAANAGHEYPIIRHADGSYALYKDKHGFVIGGMEGVRYREYELQLEPGARVFVYTDGVPEANNHANELFGMERLLNALNAAPDAHPDQVLKNVRKAVDDFVEDAEQFDDLTMLCLEYKGTDHTKEDAFVKELTLPAVTANIPVVTDFVDELLDARDCPMKAKMQLDVAIDEVFANIASYAYAPQTGDATVRFSFDEATRTVRLIFLDSGTPFDPLAQADPDVTLSVEERGVGGLGIFITKKTMDDVQYEYKDGQNRLTLVKKI